MEAETRSTSKMELTCNICQCRGKPFLWSQSTKSIQSEFTSNVVRGNFKVSRSFWRYTSSCRTLRFQASELHVIKCKWSYKASFLKKQKQTRTWLWIIAYHLTSYNPLLVQEMVSAQRDGMNTSLPPELYAQSGHIFDRIYFCHHYSLSNDPSLCLKHLSLNPWLLYSSEVGS